MPNNADGYSKNHNDIHKKDTQSKVGVSPETVVFVSGVARMSICTHSLFGISLHFLYLCILFC